MAKHYVKFSVGAEDRARQLFSGDVDPLQSAFDDLTARGQRIRFSRRAPTESGPCVEIAGTRCYALVGPDRRQQGVLFAFSVRENTFGNSVSAPADYLGAFQLWHSSLASADSIDNLFAPTHLAKPTHAEAVVQPRGRVTPTADLRRYFAAVPKEVRALYWPDIAAAAPMAFHITNACRTWRKHSLDMLSLPTKGSWQESVLRGSASMPPSRHNADAIWPLFDFLLLERFATSVQGAPASEKRFQALLQDIATLPLPEAQRARYWANLIVQQDADALVCDVTAFTAALSVLDAHKQDIWGRHIDDAVRDLCGRFADHELLSLLRTRIDLADAHDLSIAEVLTDWTRAVTPASNQTTSTTPALDIGSSHATPGDGTSPAQPDAPSPIFSNVATVPGLALEQWVLSTLGTDDDTVALLRRGARTLLSLLNGIDREPSSTTVLLRLSEHAETAQDAITPWRVLPPADRIARQRAACAEAHARARDVVPSGVLADLLSAGIEPEALIEIADLCKHAHIWNAMPSWWWATTSSTHSSNSQADRQEPEEWMRSFSQAPNRRLAQFAYKLICDNEFAIARPSLLRAIPPPEQGVEPDRHFESALRELTEIYSTVQRFQERFPALVPLLGAGVSQEDFASIAIRVASLGDWLSSPCIEQVAADLVASPSTASARLTAYEKKLANLQLLGLTQESIRALGSGEIRKGVDFETPAGPETPVLEIGHAFVPSENGGNRAPRVAFRPFDDNTEFGTVAVPITLRAPANAAVRLSLQYTTIIDPDLAKWPDARERAEVAPREVTLLDTHWTRPSKQDHWQHTFICNIPVRRPSPGDTISIALVAADAESGRTLGRSKQLHWTLSHVPPSDASDSRPTIPLQWSEGINLDYVRNHPVGPQKYGNRLLDRVRAGDSFAVVAPRRFGKSTLIEHLQRLLAADTLTLNLVCADYRIAGALTIDHRRLWEQVADRLPTLFPERPPHVALRFDGGSPPLPTADSFDAVRRALLESGKAGLVVFFDEAHLLFAGGGSVEYSSRLRTLLTTRLSRRDTDRAPLMFSFFGVPTMSANRLGELAPYLNPVSDHSLDADELHRLARQFTSGRLEMTREARERIVAISSNLLILQRVLRRVRDHVQDRFRTWVIRQDVMEVEDQFKRELLLGEDPENVRRYLLDVLNDSVDLEQWRPITAYPLALALAVAHRDKFRGDEAISWANEILSNWAAALLAGRSCLPRFDDPITNAEHLETLAELGIYRGGRFISEFLECALAGSVNSQHIPTDEKLEEAILRAGVPAVQLPADLTFVSRGGQAEVFRTPDAVLAVRTVPIETAAERARFLGRLPLFDVIRKLDRGNDPRVAHIMHLRDVGLATVNGLSCAVQTYDWIDGTSLAERRRAGPLPCNVVVRIGHQIAGALSLLHESGVWHRDVCPRNIILKEDQLLAVLIDFGFATFSNRGRTSLAETDDAFPAPEVRLSPPQWSSAADVYSVAKTIGALLDPGARESQAVLKALSPFTTERHSERGTLAGLMSSLERLELELHTRRDTNDFQERLSRLVNDESLMFVLRRRTNEIDAFALGLYQTVGARAAKAANLVNQVAEKKRRTSIGEWLRDTYGNGRHPDELRIYVDLRNSDSHGAADIAQTRFAAHRHDPRALMRQGATRLAQWLEIRELPEVVDYLLAAARREP